ncbi:aldose 1-epimerase-like [Abrus precatorius]|uniref:Aldose 1-epimerase n=1 Tax=Abrus precatorius TaxID=3816 RepID=A0A8B8K4J8_ABRPR|nr:aldose 1-epimerase-like [Abrus precatorius]
MFKSFLFATFLLALLLIAQAREDDKNIGLYQLKRGNMQLNFTNYGATIISVILPDRHGNLADVTLGYDFIQQYQNDTCYFGALIGRVANRIGHAQFTLDGKTYQLPANDHGNTLHGGTTGFSDVVWTVESHREDSHITFTYDSCDREEGFPGQLKVSVTYMLIGTNKLAVKMIANPVDKATPVNLAQHSYWNLRGHNSGDILSHKVQIFGSHITPVDDKLIPTGEIQSVKGTPYDFLEPKEVGSQINDLPGLYDMNYVLDKGSSEHFRKVAIIKDDVSGRKLELWSNQPGVQFYTSGMLKDTKGKDGAIYHKHAGIAMETQGFPDAVNRPNFPSQIVRPGETYKHFMVYRFTAE